MPRPPDLVDWRGARQAGVVTPRTDYGFVAAYDVVDDDLPRLLRDITARIEELTQGWPDRLDDVAQASLPPSDTGELGYDKREDGRLTITVGFGASLFDGRFGLQGRKPSSLKSMPSFAGDNLDPRRCHGDLLLIVQADHAMITHHALRDIMRRTKGRLVGRWAQACFQRHTVERQGKGPNVAPAIGLLGFADGSQNIPVAAHERIFTADGGTYVAVRLIRLKIERWDRLSRTAQEDSIGRRKLNGAPLEGGREQDVPKLDRRTPVDAHIRLANPRTGRDSERRRFLRRGFVYNNNFDEYGLLDSGSVFMAFCRDVQAQFEATKRGTHGQDLDEYMVAVGGGYFFCPPGARGSGAYIGRDLID